MSSVTLSRGSCLVTPAHSTNGLVFLAVSESQSPVFAPSSFRLKRFMMSGEALLKLVSRFLPTTGMVDEIYISLLRNVRRGEVCTSTPRTCWWRLSETGDRFRPESWEKL